MQEYARRIVSQVKVLDGMEHVPQPDDHTSVCECHRQASAAEVSTACCTDTLNITSILIRLILCIFLQSKTAFVKLELIVIGKLDIFGFAH